MNNFSYILFTDGASRGNPGKSGIGFVLWENDKKVIEQCYYIGNTTNNHAEYLALLVGVYESYLLYKMPSITIYSDSLLMVNQLKGIFKIKNSLLLNCFLYYKKIQCYIDINVIHILRNNNSDADILANKGIDTNNSLPLPIIKKLFFNNCFIDSFLYTKQN